MSTTTKARVYLIDENQPLMLETVAIMKGGYVSGNREDDVWVTIPAWRIHHLEKVHHDVVE